MAPTRAGWIGISGSLIVAAALLAHAPAATAEVPDTVRREIASLIEDLSLLYSGVDLTHAGFTVEESGTGYRVTLDSVRLMAGTGRHPEPGAVVLVLEPEDDGYRIKGIEMPRSFPLKSVNGGDAGQITVAGYALTGLWQRSASALVESELHLADLRLDNWPEEMTLEEVKAVTRLSPAGEGLWQETVDVEVSEFRHSRQGLSAYMSGGKLHLLCEGVDLDQYMALQRLLDEAEQQDLARDAVDIALLGELRQAGNAARAFQFEMAARDLLFDADGDEPVVIPKAQISVSAEGLDGELARAIVHLAFDGADLPVAEHHGGGNQSAVGPQSLDLNIAIDALPWPPFWQSFIDLAYGGSPESHDEGLWRLGLALQDAGTRLRLLPSRVASETTTVRGDGEMHYDPAAALGIVASLAFEIEGLLIAKGSVLGSADRETVGMLAQLEELGRPAPGPDGMPNYRYDIVLGADGVLTVNGKPFSIVEGMEN